MKNILPFCAKMRYVCLIVILFLSAGLRAQESRLFKDCKLSAGYSFMWGTRTMVVLKRSSDRRRLHWGWLMLSVTPKFFTYNGK
jgi:hypothetical protein